MSRFLNNLRDLLNTKADRTIELDIQGGTAICAVRDGHGEINNFQQEIKLDPQQLPDWNPLFTELAQQNYRPNTRLSIRLPDDFAKLILLNVDNKIHRQSKLDEFVNWLLTNEYHLDVEQFSVRFQRCNRNTSTLLVSLVNRAVLESILQASIAHKIPVNVIEPFSVAMINKSVLDSGLILTLDCNACQLIMLERNCPTIVRSLALDRHKIEEEVDRLGKISPINSSISILQHGHECDGLYAELESGFQERGYTIIKSGDNNND